MHVCIYLLGNNYAGRRRSTHFLSNTTAPLLKSNQTLLLAERYPHIELSVLVCKNISYLSQQVKFWVRYITSVTCTYLCQICNAITDTLIELIESNVLFSLRILCSKTIYRHEINNDVSLLFHKTHRQWVPSICIFFSWDKMTPIW